MRQIRIDLQRGPALSPRFVSLADGQQRSGKIAPNVRPIGIGIDGREVMGNGQIRPIFIRQQQICGLELGLDIIRPPGGGFEIFIQCAVLVALRKKRIGVMDADLGIIGIEGDGFFVIVHRLFDVILAHEKHSHAVHGNGEIGGEAKGLAELRLGGGQVVIVFLYDAPLEMSERLIGGELIQLRIIGAGLSPVLLLLGLGDAGSVGEGGVFVAEVAPGHPAIWVALGDVGPEDQLVLIEIALTPGEGAENCQNEYRAERAEMADSRGGEDDQADAGLILEMVGDEGIAHRVEIDEAERGKERAGEE